MKKIYLIILTLLWVSLMGRLLYTEYLAPQSGQYISLETGLKDLPSESEWMNIFHEDRKMGYAVYSIDNQGEKGYLIRSTTNLNVVFGGLKSDIYLESRAWIDTLFRLQEFSFKMVSDQYSTHVIGTKAGTNMSLGIIQDDDTLYQNYPVPADLYSYTAIQPMVASRGIEAGDVVKVPAYDPMSNEMADVIISHEGKELVDVGDEKMMLNKLRIDFKGIPSIIWLDDNGVTFREESIMGMTMERTTPQEALQKSEGQGLDLLQNFAVIPNMPVRSPKKLKHLVLELEGINASVFTAKQSERQQMTAGEKIRLNLSTQADVVDVSDLEQALRSSEMIQSEHAALREKAREILVLARTDKEKSERLTQWVFDYLEKRPVASISGAVDILNTGVGDCTEHTTLFTALSRAAGIPTKVHIGLVYLQGRFLFHAWPVVAINGEWVDVDPSLNQFPADATHIAFLEGDFENLSNLLPVLGKVQIRVLEQVY